jgi:hypothetical protein
VEVFTGYAGLVVLAAVCFFGLQAGWSFVYERRRGLRPRMFAPVELPEPDGEGRFSVENATDGGKVWYFEDGKKALKYRDALRAQGHKVTLRDGEKIR